jgi:pimeloyl-ACP methyl ester carboxylesterase
MIAALLATPLVLGLLVSPAAQAAAPDSAAGSYPPVSNIAWGPCVPAQAGLECGTFKVPLDHDQPRGPMIDLALARVPATDQANRIGSLFVNPGGPGGSGVEFVQAAGQDLSQSLDGRFDIVGFDPRGVGSSTPLICFESRDQLIEALSLLQFPYTEAEEAAQEASDIRIAAACTQRGGPIINHMSTADVARDLDRLRAAVGDRQLSYLGYSYGTQLGSVYANLFPGRVRALALDGVLDPVAWTTGTPATKNVPFTARLRSGQGARATQKQYFLACDRAAQDDDPDTVCGLGPNSEQRFTALGERMKTNPITLPNGAVLKYPALIATFLGGLYNVAAWPLVTEFVLALEAQSPADAANARARLASGLGVETSAEPAPFPQSIEGFPGVACTDSQNPRNYAAWPRTADRAEAKDGPFGRLWTWASSWCQPWPGRTDDRYLGPWSTPTANPALIVGNYYDPATRYQGAQRLNRLMPGSRLLSYAGSGHTAYLAAGSTCVDQAVSAYLLTKTMPAAGTVCQPEVVPFGATPAARARADRPVVGLPAVTRRALGGS